MKYVLKDAYLLVDGKDLSNRVRSITVTMSAADVESSTMGEGVVQHLAGLRSDQYEVTFASDDAAGSVNETLYPLLATADLQPTFAVKAAAHGLTPAADNPLYQTGEAILLSFTPFGGAIGALSENQVTIPSNEAIVRSFT